MASLLHVGCGRKRMTDIQARFDPAHWTETRLDIDPAVAPDIVGSITDMAAVASGSVDAVFSSHNIEHLYPHEVPLALKEFLRVLSPAGFLVITCPDLQEVARLIAEDKLLDPAYVSPAGPIAPLDILYGHRPALAAGNLYMAHRCGFTARVLLGTLRGVGFASVAGVRRPKSYELWALATRASLERDAIEALARAHFPAWRN